MTRKERISELVNKHFGNEWEVIQEVIKGYLTSNEVSNNPMYWGNDFDRCAAFLVDDFRWSGNSFIINFYERQHDMEQANEIWWHCQRQADTIIEEDGYNFDVDNMSLYDFINEMLLQEVGQVLSDNFDRLKDMLIELYYLEWLA